MISRRLQIFISSTYLDLKDERQATVEAVLAVGHIPAGMELFSAEDRSQWETIKRWIDDSDVLILLIGGRYGSIEKQSGKSFTHLEYDYAHDRGKPVFGISLDESYIDRKIAQLGKDAIEQKECSNFAAFKDTVLSHTCKVVYNLDQVKLAVFQSLTNSANELGKNSGWIRATDVADSRALVEQIALLQAEIEQLKRKAPEASDGAYFQMFEKMSRRVVRVPALNQKHFSEKQCTLLELFYAYSSDIVRGLRVTLALFNVSDSSEINLAHTIVGLLIAFGLAKEATGLNATFMATELGEHAAAYLLQEGMPEFYLM